MAPNRDPIPLTRYRRLVAEWHRKLNGSLRPADLTSGSAVQVWWQCLVQHDHVWRTCPCRRIRPNKISGCPFCSGRRPSRSYNLQTFAPHIAREWHRTRNGALTPRDVLPGSQTPVWWRCSKNRAHEWSMRPHERTGIWKQGCPICAGKRIDRTNSLANLHPEIAAEWHPTRNDKAPDAVHARAVKKKYWWRCRVTSRHVWAATVCARTVDGTGCPRCRELARRRDARDKARPI